MQRLVFELELIRDQVSDFAMWISSAVDSGDVTVSLDASRHLQEVDRVMQGLENLSDVLKAAGSNELCGSFLLVVTEKTYLLDMKKRLRGCPVDASEPGACELF